VVQVGQGVTTVPLEIMEQLEAHHLHPVALLVSPLMAVEEVQVVTVRQAIMVVVAAVAAELAVWEIRDQITLAAEAVTQQFQVVLQEMLIE
jgi:hypothetical protein